MLEQFQVAEASTIGSYHRQLGKNNQDAYYSVRTEEVLIAAVCDGCGSSLHSEVGAQLGVKWVVNTILHTLATPNQGPPTEAKFWLTVFHSLLLKVQKTIIGLTDLSMGLKDANLDAIKDYFLFTIVATLITPTTTVIVALGDGVIILNGEIMALGPFPHNAPPYLTYGLWERENPEWHFKIKASLPTDQVKSLIIGTDGVMDLIDIGHKPIPGKTELVGDISQLWRDDRYFQNPDFLRRRLTLINRNFVLPNWEEQRLVPTQGLLPDDTTLIVIRE